MANISPELAIPDDILETLFAASKLSTPEKSLEFLIERSRSHDERLELTSKGVLPAALKLVQLFTNVLNQQLPLLALKLLRILCAGERTNQDLFVKLNGVGIVSNILISAALFPDQNCTLIRSGLQVLANVSLAGREHQNAIWQELFPDGFTALARVRRRETCDPLCMIVYACSNGIAEILRMICDGSGLSTVSEIVQTASAVGFGEDWLKLLLSRICLEESYLPHLFQKLQMAGSKTGECNTICDEYFSPEQAFLLQTVSDILNERLEEIMVSKDIAWFVFGIFKKSIGVLKQASRASSGLPTGITVIDVLGYSLILLRDICAQDSKIKHRGNSEDVADELLSQELVVFLLSLLGKLEPPTVIRKAVKKDEDAHETGPSKPITCPYKGFRRDIVAVIGNCIYRRKTIQDEIRRVNCIPLLLQQCVTDEDNPFLREWGIWSVRNLLEDNEENQQSVAELELQGSVETPQIASLGLRVQIDETTGRPKLVNALQGFEIIFKHQVEVGEQVEEIRIFTKEEL